MSRFNFAALAQRKSSQLIIGLQHGLARANRAMPWAAPAPVPIKGILKVRLPQSPGKAKAQVGTGIWCLPRPWTQTPATSVSEMKLRVRKVRPDQLALMRLKRKGVRFAPDMEEVRFLPASDTNERRWLRSYHRPDFDRFEWDAEMEEKARLPLGGEDVEEDVKEKVKKEAKEVDDSFDAGAFLRRVAAGLVRVTGSRWFGVAVHLVSWPIIVHRHGTLIQRGLGTAGRYVVRNVDFHELLSDLLSDLAAGILSA